MTEYRTRKRGIYRSRNGLILGVCRGVADYFDISVFWVRAGMVIIFLLSGFWPVIGIYLVAALLMKAEPVSSFANEDEREFYDTYAQSPQSAAQRLKKKFHDLERRIRRMEDSVTGREYEWDRKFNSSN
ncbi:MAG: envelope stress response membrane protein PspC [Desulfocapsaceae bacterium]|jgi:phage shock protein C